MLLSEFICMGMRFSLFYDVTQRRLVVSYWLLQQPISHIFMGQAAQE
jgi:hypothetical protein